MFAGSTDRLPLEPVDDGVAAVAPEIPAGDFQRAVNFYKNILNVDIKTIENGNEKMGFFPAESKELRGAISYSPGFTPSKDGVLINFYAGSNLDSFLDKVKKNGGEIVIPKTKIEAEGEGYFATFIDSEGNRLGANSDS